jgi:hypothetical protein
MLRITLLAEKASETPALPGNGCPILQSLLLSSGEFGLQREIEPRALNSNETFVTGG